MSDLHVYGRHARALREERQCHGAAICDGRPMKLVLADHVDLQPPWSDVAVH